MGLGSVSNLRDMLGEYPPPLFLEEACSKYNPKLKTLHCLQTPKMQPEPKKKTKTKADLELTFSRVGPMVVSGSSTEKRNNPQMVNNNYDCRKPKYLTIEYVDPER